MQAMTLTTPLEAGGEMFSRPRTESVFLQRSSMPRPLSEATEIFDTTDIEDGSGSGSDFEEAESEDEVVDRKEQVYEQPPSPKGSLDSLDGRRRSQTTISSYDEAPTPSSSSIRSRRRPMELRIKPVEGPKGPHLFRSSQSSSDSSFDYALQMSPLLPKQPPLRTDTAFSQDTLTPVSQLQYQQQNQQQQQQNFSIDAVMSQSPINISFAESEIRRWNPTQVIDWMVDSEMEESVIECFERHDISGAVLVDLQFDDLKELGIESFGKRHQLWNALAALQGIEGRVSPQPTPFQDTSRPCTTNTRRSPSRNRNACETPIESDGQPFEQSGGKKRRGRKAPKALDTITPMESVSIVAIEQLLPKPHTCNKGERCAKWRKQQRELQQLREDQGLGRFPISPTKGGRIFVQGDPGNAWTAENIVPREVDRQNEDVRPQSEMPSVVASSDALGHSQMPAFTLHADMLDQLDKRDAQANVRQFLDFQHVQTPSPPVEDHYLDGTLTPVEKRSATAPPERQHREPLPLFPEEHLQPFRSQWHAQPDLRPPQQMQSPHQQLKSLPKLAIPRSATAGPQGNTLRSPEAQITTLRSPEPQSNIPRSATASPGAQTIYRLGTPASEMDVPVTAVPTGPISRDTSQSVPPSMQYREQQSLSRSHSRAQAWHRPSFALPALKENEPFSPASEDAQPRPSLSSARTGSSHSTATSSSTAAGSQPKSSLDSTTSSTRIQDPAHHSPQTQHFGYGAECSHAGWMKKRQRTRMLRHEWADQHCRLTGTRLAMHSNARLNSTAKETIDVDAYAVACSTAPSSSKLSAAFKNLQTKDANASGKGKAGNVDDAAFAFQLVPNRDAVGLSAAERKAAAGGKTHHFAVKSKDERIDWMRELMLAKALRQKRDGYEVEVYGGQI